MKQRHSSAAISIAQRTPEAEEMLPASISERTVKKLTAHTIPPNTLRAKIILKIALGSIERRLEMKEWISLFLVLAINVFLIISELYFL
jgi:hypothetical protein